jgi:hypothetical protein
MILNLVEEDASDSDDSDENRVLKRLFFHKTTESPTKPTPSVLGNLVFGSSTAASRHHFSSFSLI